MKRKLRPIRWKESERRGWSASHPREMRTVFLALTVVFENLVLTGQTQASHHYRFIAAGLTIPAILAGAGGLFFLLLLTALLGIRRKPTDQGADGHDVTPERHDARVNVLEDKCRALEDRYESLSDG